MNYDRMKEELKKTESAKICSQNPVDELEKQNSQRRMEFEDRETRVYRIFRSSCYISYTIFILGFLHLNAKVTLHTSTVAAVEFNFWFDKTIWFDDSTFIWNGNVVSPPQIRTTLGICLEPQTVHAPLSRLQGWHKSMKTLLDLPRYESK